MKPRLPTTLACLAGALLVAAIGCADAGASSGMSSPPPPWLARINMYRAMVNLPPLANDPALSEGSQNHAIYLIKNFSKGVREGAADSAELSSESSAKPFYTITGRAAASHCEIDFDLEEHQSPERAIDRWMSGTVHRMLLLNPALRRIGYGYYCEGGVCVQILDVMNGLTKEPTDPKTQLAIEFPPANSTLSLNELPHEEPNPLTACPGYEYPVGLPITFEIGSFVGARLDRFSIVSNGDPPGAPPIEACGYDAFSYRNDARSHLAQVVGSLKAFSGVVVIPRHPLTPGSYLAAVTVNGKEYSWSFAIAPNDSQSAAR